MSPKRGITLTQCGILLIVGLTAANFVVAYHYYLKGVTDGIGKVAFDRKETDCSEKTRLSVPVLKAIWAHPESFDQFTIDEWQSIGKTCIEHLDAISFPEMKKYGRNKDYEYYSKLVTELKSLTAQLPERK